MRKNERAPHASNDDSDIPGCSSELKTALPSHSWILPLCGWYEKQARPLPWRQTSDPYQIWISEVMLQQTQVLTVIPYYQNFLARFPDVYRLAGAHLEEVLTAWSGLGYYSRARNLHRGAKVIVDKFAGQMPRDRTVLLKVPGIGPYTAGAVLSIAFDFPVPLVDGNVERVFARLFGISDPVKSRAAQLRFWEHAEAAVGLAPSPRTFNQALMELGAIVCTKSAPRCDRCPIQSHCHALKHHRQVELPVKSPRRAQKNLWWMGLVFEKNGGFLLQKNQEGGWWAGMWDFPHRDAANENALTRQANQISKQFPSARETVALSHHQHTVTHHKIQVRPMLIRLRRKPSSLPKGKWFSLSEIRKLPLSGLARKIVTQLDLVTEL